MNNQQYSTPKKRILKITLLIGALLVLFSGVAYGSWKIFYRPEQVIVEEEPAVENNVSEPIGTDEPDVTADWKIYRNEQYGFSIKYPANQGIKAFEPNGSYKTTTIVEFRPQFAWNSQGSEGGELARLEIAYKINEKGLSLEEYILELWNNTLNFSAYNDGQPLTRELLSSFSIGGADTYTLKIPSDNTSQYIYVLHEDRILIFYILSEGEFKGVSDQMLSTFKFLQD